MLISTTGSDSVKAHNQSPKGVVSMSLHYGASKLIDNAVTALWDAGYVISVAAGNKDADSCHYSPQRVVNVSWSAYFVR